MRGDKTESCRGGQCKMYTLGGSELLFPNYVAIEVEL